MSSFDLNYLPLSGNFMDLLKDEAWMQAMDEAELVGVGSVLAGVAQAIGWMQTWPELYTYSHYEQLSSLVARGFAAVLQAIERELQRRQPVSRKEAFWAEVRSLRAEMAAEGVEVEPDEIWGDVRDRSSGREVAL